MNISHLFDMHKELRKKKGLKVLARVNKDMVNRAFNNPKQIIGCMWKMAKVGGRERGKNNS